MKRAFAAVQRRVAVTTDPWPSVGRLRTPKPRLVVPLERLPGRRSSEEALERLRTIDANARLEFAVVTDGTRAAVRLGQQVTEIHGRAGTVDIGDLAPLAKTSDREREEAARHCAYVVISPKTSSPNPYEQYLTLFRIAWAYGEVGGACGVINPLALSFTSPVGVQNLISEEMIAQCRTRIPPHVFTGFAGYHGTGGIWCATKGFEVFGVSNLASFAIGTDTDAVFDELWKMFLFAYEEGGILEPGHDVSFASDPSTLRLHRVSDVAPGWEPQLETPGGTLVLVPTALDQA